jgi:hypothetical protein
MTAKTQHTIALLALQARRNAIAQRIDTPSDAWEEIEEIAQINAEIKPMLTVLGRQDEQRDPDNTAEVTSYVERRTRDQNRIDLVLNPDGDPLPGGFYVYLQYNGDFDRDHAGGPDSQPTGPFESLAEAMLFADDMEDSKPIEERNAERQRIETKAVDKRKTGRSRGILKG